MTQTSFQHVVEPEAIKFFQKNGFTKIENVITKPELDLYVSLMTDMVQELIPTEGKRDDMNGHVDRTFSEMENLSRIRHPHVLTKKLDACEFFTKGRDICNQLYGVEKDFTMETCQFMIKHAKTNVETPWHQDAYYKELHPEYKILPDDSMANVWMALEDCDVENGCLAFSPVPLKSKSLMKHWAAGNGLNMVTCRSPPPNNQPFVDVPLNAGDLVVFNSYTYHYSHPNVSDRRRPAFGALFRPKRMLHKIYRLSTLMGRP